MVVQLSLNGSIEEIWPFRRCSGSEHEENANEVHTATIKNYQYVRLMSDKYCEIKEANCRQECLVFVTDLRKNNGNKSRGSYDHATCL